MQQEFIDLFCRVDAIPLTALLDCIQFCLRPPFAAEIRTDRYSRREASVSRHFGAKQTDSGISEPWVAKVEQTNCGKTLNRQLFSLPLFCRC